MDAPITALAQRAAETSGPLLLHLRDRSAATVILVEHDPLVVASYLGTDARAIGRSTALPVQPTAGARPAEASIHRARSHSDSTVT